MHQVIDGAMGEGGGQVVRSSMSIAAITGQAVEIRNVRARRNPPGLKAQHLTAARAAAEICDGELVGGEVGSKNLQILPGTLRGGEYCFDIGTAGSTMLVMQTILPALLCAEQPSQVELIGGTHNTMAPSWDFAHRVYLPMLRKMGADVKCSLHRRGFYPRGGGRVTVEIQPCSWRPLDLLQRGKLVSQQALALCAKLPESIGEREVDVMLRSLQWPAKHGMVITDDDSYSPGNLAMIDMQFEHCGELICEHGKVGLPAEKVAKRAVRAAKTYLEADVPVGEHLADQLMTPMAIAAWKGAGASRLRTLALSKHSDTLVLLLSQLLGVTVAVDSMPKSAAVEISA